MTDPQNEFQSAIRSIYDEYIKHGCPCRYPRFREVAGFYYEDHGLSPVTLHEQIAFLGLLLNPESGIDSVYKLKGPPPGDMYTCSVCNSAIKFHGVELSAYFWCDYIRIETRLPDIGAEPIKPCPLYAGPTGIDAQEPETVAIIDTLFVRAETIEEFIEYMIASA